MTWDPEAPQGAESEKIKYRIVPYTRGRGIDLGCGPKKAFPHFIGVDNCVDTKLFGTPIEPDIRIEDCRKLPFESVSLDFVFSSHLLEHAEDHHGALTEWWRTLKVGGYLVLYLPHADLYPNIGEPGANPDHKHDFRPADIRRAMASVAEHTRSGFDLVVSEVRAQANEYSFLTVFRKLDTRVQLESHRAPKPEKTVCVCRFGGFGDMLQAANLLPELQRQGFHVTVMTTPAGQDILHHDPHVDAWMIQDKDQVPNQELTAYWEEWAPRFTRWVNLSESVEGTLLALPGRANHTWPQAMRHRELNRNYGEFAADLAQIPYRSETRFYPTDEERAWAREYLASLPGTERVLYALAGSSLHKFYPWQDAVIARLMSETEASVLLVGDMACKILEHGWEAEPRVRCASGELSIRQTLTLAQLVDVVIGPETGVLNAVAFETDVAKVVLLSHSSVENLTKHWVRTTSMIPHAAIACYPCHQLHFGSKYCAVHPDSGAAMCAASIDPDDIFAAITQHVERTGEPCPTA